MPALSDPAVDASTKAPLIAAAARGACPRRDAPTLFAGPVRFAPANVGDGPAVFLTLEYRNKAREGRIAASEGEG